MAWEQWLLQHEVTLRLLAFFGIRLSMRGRDRDEKRRGLLMAVMAIVLVANVVIWTI